MVLFASMEAFDGMEKWAFVQQTKGARKQRRKYGAQKWIALYLNHHCPAS